MARKRPTRTPRPVPPASTPTPDSPAVSPEAADLWHARRADVIAAEVVLGAERIDDGTRTGHLIGDVFFAATLPAGRDRSDIWSWVPGSTPPHFGTDPHDFIVIEKCIEADGLQAQYLRHLLGTPNADATTFTLADAFKIATAPLIDKLLAAIHVHLDRIEADQPKE